LAGSNAGSGNIDLPQRVPFRINEIAVVERVEGRCGQFVCRSAFSASGAASGSGFVCCGVSAM
jgi:hypothetical protein